MHHGKDLFQLQHELVEMKVDMAVSKAIDRVVEQIRSLRDEMHTDFSSLQNEMVNRFSSLDNRVIAIETKMGMVHAKRKGWYDRFMDHFFKAGWAWLSIIFAYLILHVK
jgi:hypothetical protein